MHPVRPAGETIGELCGWVMVRDARGACACEVGCAVGESSFAAAMRDSFNVWARRKEMLAFLRLKLPMLGADKA